MNNLELVIDNYYERQKEIIENNNLRKNARSYKSQLNKYIVNRDKQLSTFLLDAKLLFHLESEENLQIRNPRIKNRCVQYYYLEKEELIAYIGFRSKIRKNEKPLNPQSNFIVIYIMEVLNDLYTNVFSKKIELINKLEKMFYKPKKFRELIIEAYENLFFQCQENLNLNQFEKKYNLNNLFNNYYEDKSVFAINEFLINQASNKIELSEIDKYLITKSFSYIIEESLKEKIHINFNGMKLFLEDELVPGYINHAIVLNKLYTFYPIDKSVSFYREDGSFLELKNGFLKVYKNPIFNFDYFSKLIFFIKENFRKNLIHNYLEKTENTTDKMSYFFKKMFSNTECKEKLNTIQKNWIKQNPNIINAYDKTLKQIKYESERKNFDLNMNAIKNIRVKSAEIQSKLIIEEETDQFNITEDSNDINNSIMYFENIKKHKKENNNFEKKEIFETNKFYNVYTELINSLNLIQKQVLKLLLNGSVEEAIVFSKDNAIMLSLVIEEINEKAVEITEDIIIEDNQILKDYISDLKYVFIEE